MAAICVSSAPLPGAVAMATVRRLLACSLADEFEVRDTPEGCVAHVHVGTPDSIPPELLDSGGRPLAVYTFAEATRVPRRWVSALERCDDVWAPSHFAANALVASGLTRPVRVVPLAIESPERPLPPPPADSPFTFLWQGGRLKAYSYGRPHDGDRKRGLLVETAFRKADLPHSRLILKYLPVEGTSYDFHLGCIRYVCKQMTNAEVGQLDAAADVFLWPTMGEGFGLPPLEKLAQGIPAYATFWSGPAEYLQDFPLRRLEPDRIETVQFNGAAAEMAVVDESTLIDTMRHCYEKRRELAELRPRLWAIARERWSLPRRMQPAVRAAIGELLHLPASCVRR